MKRCVRVLTALCVVFFSTAFVVGPVPHAAEPTDVDTAQRPAWADSLLPLYLYTEGVKQQNILGDSLRAEQLFREAVAQDSTYDAAYYQLALLHLNRPSQSSAALREARRAYRLDTTNLWYHTLYGQALLVSHRYDEALGVFRDLVNADPQNADFYRVLAALYELQEQPFSAITTLDSAELRVGRIPELSTMKRQLLLRTRQIDRAVAEAEALVADAPYDPSNQVALAELYAMKGQDSLAMNHYEVAMRIDSTALETLMSLSDFYSERQNYRALLGVTRGIFNSDQMSLDQKISRFELFTSDIKFYQQYYFQIHDLATILSYRYPREERVVELYGNHLIRTGDLDGALNFYKMHLADRPPKSAYYECVIDIESYLQRRDSVERYVNEALALFPEHLPFLLARGSALNYAGRYTEAIKHYKAILPAAQTDSLKATIWGIIGDTWHLEAGLGDTSLEELQQQGKHSSRAKKAMRECYKAYEQSLRLRPDNPLILNNYAYFLSVEGQQLDRALAMSSRAVALTDNNPTYLDTYAWVLYRMRRYDEAKKVQQQALARDGQQTATLLVHYGDILAAMGNRALAESYWRRALEKGFDTDAITRRVNAEPAIPSKH